MPQQTQCQRFKYYEEDHPNLTKSNVYKKTSFVVLNSKRDQKFSLETGVYRKKSQSQNQSFPIKYAGAGLCVSRNHIYIHIYIFPDVQWSISENV